MLEPSRTQSPLLSNVVCVRAGLCKEAGQRVQDYVGVKEVGSGRGGGERRKGDGMDILYTHNHLDTFNSNFILLVQLDSVLKFILK